MPKVKGVIFDFNGVMVDDYPLQKEAWGKMSIKLRGHPVTDEEMVQKIRGVPSKDTIKYISEKQLSEEEISKLAKEKDTIIAHLFTTSPLFKLADGLEEFLDELKTKRTPITIATSSSKDIFSLSFNKLNLQRWFNINQILYNDGRHKGKPAPDPYILAAEKISLEPEQCVVFEDAKSGIQSAYAAGVKNIIVVGSKENLPMLTALPGVVKGIHDFTEIKVDKIF